MVRLAFKMKLLAGNVSEYRKRHDEIWPELVNLIRQHGIHDYSIFLDEHTGDLFGVLGIADPKQLDLLPQHDLMKKWWVYMSDLMEVNADFSPLSIPLTEVFYLP